MKVIFLDFDGVLTSTRTCVALDGRGLWTTADPVAIALVKRLCDEFSAKIVVSSTWREIYDREGLMLYLHQAGLHRNYIHNDWRTPSTRMSSWRAEEIRTWLESHSEITGFVIIDDMDFSSSEELKEHAVKTSGTNGMMYEHYDQAKKILSSPMLFRPGNSVSKSSDAQVVSVEKTQS